MKKFPEKIYVKVDGDVDGSDILIAEPDFDQFKDEVNGQPIAVYELVEVGKLTVEKYIHDRKKQTRSQD